MRAGAARGPETMRVTFDMRDTLGQPIRDPETFFTFRRLSDSRQIGDQIALELTSATPVFELPVATGTGEVLVCEIDPKRYRFVHSPVFFRNPGSITKPVRLLREPREWRAQYTKWDNLPPAFDELKRVLVGSPKVTIFNGAAPLADLLVEDAYDGLDGDQVALAKTSLLNAYFRLRTAVDPVSGTRNWFSFVSRLIAIGRERFLAFVDPEMETLVRQISTHIDQFRADYERTPAENHRGNVPASLRNRITDMVSIKSSHDKGNFQLTITHLASPDEVLLDADIDESGTLFGHLLDLFKHKVSGGTHPHDIHELLLLQEGQTPGFDLGYRLV